MARTPKLPKFTLTKDEKRGDWALRQDGATRAKARFETKADATKGGALAKAVGADGGSVKIQTVKGRFQEERTYPRDRDPSSSEG